MEGEWRLPENELPDEGVKVLCYGSKGGWYIAEMFERQGVKEWYMRGKVYARPVAWMPLPEPYRRG